MGTTILKRLKFHIRYVTIFNASGTVFEETKVTIASIHSYEDAKLWWRFKVNDIQNDSCTIDTWKDLKKELRAQFFLENVGFIARRKLCKFRHTGTMQDYIKQFSTVMLDIQDMLEKDKVSCFVGPSCGPGLNYTNRKSKIFPLLLLDQREC